MCSPLPQKKKKIITFGIRDGSLSKITNSDAREIKDFLYDVRK